MQFSFEGRILKSLPILDTSHLLSKCNASTLLKMYVLVNFE